jgi:hypothetical protein
MSDAMSDDSRLAAPRTGEYQDWPIGMGYRLTLRRIQSCKKIHEY